jgi:osmotically-inducible protein OsmY
MKNFLLVLLLSCGFLSLQGCPAIIAGAAVGVAGTAIIYDHQNIKASFGDQNISYAISNKLKATPDITQQCHIVVGTDNGTVLLAGQAPTAALKQKAENIAKTVSGIKRLYNEITIEGPTSNLTRAGDSWITTKVKSQLLATKNLKSGEFKIITENGTVFLMGEASRSQAQLAVNAARKVDGVQKVVKIFKYVREASQTPNQN